MAEIGALIGDPARMNMLISLALTSELSARELAHVAGVTPQTASSHIAKLATAGLIKVRKQGRNHLHRLGSDTVSTLLDTLQLATTLDTSPACDAETRVAEDTRAVRSCHGHLGGEVAVGLADVLLMETSCGPSLTPDGRRQLTIWGLDPQVLSVDGGRLGPCLDSSIGRIHIGGQLGRAIRDRSVRLGWLRRSGHQPAFTLTPAGVHGFRNRFGLKLTAT